MTTILAGTDTSAAADLAVEQAARLAQEDDAELVVLYVQGSRDVERVVDPGRAVDPSVHLSRLAARFPGLSISTRVERGDAAEKLVEVATEVGASTIVVGNRGTHG